MLACRRLAVTPFGPQPLAMASNAISAADASATRTGTAHPARRETGAPVKSRRRRRSHYPARRATIQIRLTATPATSGP
jgi:hypothetical protein